MPKVSVLLTSYNHAGFLRQSIESILTQTYTDFELFIVDDCSTDGSREIIQSYQDPRIHTVFHPQNLGGSNWRRDIKPQMTGAYFAMAHCDDKWMPDKLEKQVLFLEMHPEYGACFTDIQVIDEEDHPYSEKDTFYYDLFSQPNRSRFEWLRRFFFQGNCLCHPSLLIRMKCYDEYGLGPVYSLNSVPDFYQWVQLALHTEIYVYPEKLACFRVRKNAANTSGDKPEGHIRSAFEMMKLLSGYLELKKTPADFLKVFPSAEKYSPATPAAVEFAYARILLDESTQPAYNLLGLLILQQLVDHPQSAAFLQETYGYTKQDFARESGKNDVFKIMGPEHFQKSTLFWNTGSGYSDVQSSTKRVYVNQAGNFFVTFSLPEDISVVSLRFDPDEECFRSYRQLTVSADGQACAFSPCYSYQETEQGIAFYTADPQFEITFPQRKNIQQVEIRGKTSLLPSFEIDAYQLRLENSRQAALHNLKEKQNTLQTEYDGLLAEFGRLQETAEEIRQNLAAVQQEKYEVQQNLAAVRQEKYEAQQNLAAVRQEKYEVQQNLAAARQEQCAEHQERLSLQNRCAVLQDELSALQKNAAAQAEYLAQHKFKAAVKALLGRLW